MELIKHNTTATDDFAAFHFQTLLMLLHPAPFHDKIINAHSTLHMLFLMQLPCSVVVIVVMRLNFLYFLFSV